MRTLLLVRNGVSHDARVLRAARVAERTVGGRAVVLGVTTAGAPAGKSTVEGVQVQRVKARGRAPGVRLRRALSGASFAWQALRVARREHPALVQANDWNTMWCGVAIKLTCGARLIYDSHELWADRNGRWEWRPWLLASEALFVRAADAVLTASPGYAQALARRYRVERPVVIRNIPESTLGPTQSSLPPSPPGPLGRGTSEPVLVYVGGLMQGRGLEQTIDALALTKQEIRLRVVGPGNADYRASLVQRASTAGVKDRVELEPPVPPAAVGTVLAQATAGLCLIQPVCRSYELTLPNKLFEYVAAGVPVLASNMPILGAVVREHGLGEVVPPTDPKAIALALDRLCEPSHRSEAAARARAFAAANTWSKESQALARIYTQALTGPHSALPVRPSVSPVGSSAPPTRPSALPVRSRRTLRMNRCRR